MKRALRSGVGTIVDMAIGGAALKAVGDSSMSSGFKEVTQVGISAGIMGRALKRNNLLGRKSKW